MNKKVSAFIVAVGMAAAPLSAKQNKVSSVESSENLQKRQAKTGKRLLRKKAEQELIKEIDQEIEEALSNDLDMVTDSKVVDEKTYQDNKMKETSTAVFLKDEMPNRGIDISREFREIFDGSSGGKAEKIYITYL